MDDFAEEKKKPEITVSVITERTSINVIEPPLATEEAAVNPVTEPTVDTVTETIFDLVTKPFAESIVNPLSEPTPIVDSGEDSNINTVIPEGSDLELVSESEPEPEFEPEPEPDLDNNHDESKKNQKLNEKASWFPEWYIVCIIVVVALIFIGLVCWFVMQRNHKKPLNTFELDVSANKISTEI